MTSTDTVSAGMRAPEVAVRLGISVRQVYRLVEEGRLPVKRYGRSIRVQRDAVEAFLASDLEELPPPGSNTLDTRPQTH